MDQARSDWLHYKNEARLAAKLGDRERTEQMRELYEAFLAFQRSKSPEQILRELRADRKLNRWRLDPRYRELLEEANRSAGGQDDVQDDR